MRLIQFLLTILKEFFINKDMHTLRKKIAVTKAIESQSMYCFYVSRFFLHNYFHN